MTPTLITAKNGKARPKNPYPKSVLLESEPRIWGINPKWKDFESAVQWHDCPEATEDGEYEAYLQCQVSYSWSKGSWVDCTNKWYEEMQFVTANKYQKIWRIVPQPQENQTMEKKITGAICKTCNSQGLRNCAHPEECGNWEPIYEDIASQKEEAKTVEGKTAEDTLIDEIIDSTNLGDTNRDIVFGSLWMLFDPSPAKSIICRAMQTYSSQQNTDLMQENERLKNLINDLHSSLNNWPGKYSILEMTDLTNLNKIKD